VFDWRFLLFLFLIFLWFFLVTYYAPFCNLISCENISLVEECLHCGRPLKVNKTAQMNAHIPRGMLIYVLRIKLSVIEFFASQIHKYALFCKISLCSLWLFFTLCFTNEVCVLWQISVCSLFLLWFSLPLSSNLVLIVLFFYKSCIKCLHKL